MASRTRSKVDGLDDRIVDGDSNWRKSFLESTDVPTLSLESQGIKIQWHDLTKTRADITRCGIARFDEVSGRMSVESALFPCKSNKIFCPGRGT